MARTAQHVARIPVASSASPIDHDTAPPSYPPRSRLVPSDSPACRQCGYVSEVVAAVVRHLPTIDVARLQRVSRTWKYEIDRSSICQERLFQNPARTGSKEMLLWTEEAQDQNAYGVCLKEVVIEEEDLDQYEITRVVAALHPIFDKSISRGDVIQCDVDSEKLLALDNASWPLAAGAWQKMFVTRPAANTMMLDLEFVFDEGPFLNQPKRVFYEIELHRSEGVQLQKVIGAIRSGLDTTASDYWTWLPDEYFSLAIDLDDYIASYGFPRFKNARLRIPGYINEDHILVQQARKSKDGKTTERFAASARIMDNAMQDTEYLMHMLRV